MGNELKVTSNLYKSKLAQNMALEMVDSLQHKGWAAVGH